VRVPASGVDQHFYDQSKINIAGDEVSYWRKVVFARPVRVKAGVAKSALYRERMQCRDHTLRALSWQLLADEGHRLRSQRADAVLPAFADGREVIEAEVGHAGPSR